MFVIVVVDGKGEAGEKGKHWVGAVVHASRAGGGDGRVQPRERDRGGGLWDRLPRRLSGFLGGRRQESPRQ